MIKKYIYKIETMYKNKKYDARINFGFPSEIKLGNNMYAQIEDITKISEHLEETYDGIVIFGKNVCEIERKLKEVEQDFKHYIKKLLECK